MKTIILILAIVIGFVFGLVIGRLRRRQSELNNVGTLQIVQTEDEDPYIFLSLDTSVDALSHEQIVVLNVTSKWVSQK